MDGKPKEILQSLLPDEVRVDAQHFTFLKYLKEGKQTQLGLLDLGNLQNMKMNIAKDAADKMLESIGPLAKGIAARIEKANKAVGHRMKFLILQWFNVARIMEYVGPDNIAREVFDYNPGCLVPSHLPDEMNGGNLPESASTYDQLTRARWFVKNIRLISVPSTLAADHPDAGAAQVSAIEARECADFVGTVMKKLGVENYGEAAGNTEREKWFNEELETQRLQILAQAQAMQLMKQLGIEPPAGGEGGGGKGKGAGGRKPSGGKAPQLKQKGAAGGEPRTVVTES